MYMKPDGALQLLGLAQRAGGVGSGEFMTETTVKEGKSHLVIVAKDASDNTKKLFRNMCSFYKVEYREYADKETIGHAIGKEFRASCSVTNQNLAAEIIKKIDGGSN